MSKVNPYIIFDFETGGLSGKKNAATEIAMLCIDGETLEEVGRYESYIKPYIGYDYDQKALDFTGNSMDKLHKQGKDLKVVVDEMVIKVKEWHKATTSTHTKKPILVGHNSHKFDRVFLQQIFKETKNDLKIFEGDEDFYGNWQPAILDTLWLSRACFAKTELTSFTLTNTIQKAGLEIVDAHKAINDVIATKDFLIYCLTHLRAELTSMGNVEQVRIRDKFRLQF
jgi:DNA polymerase III alpha subunit (gram-positive type)